MSDQERERPREATQPGRAGHVGFTGVRYTSGKYTARIWMTTKPMASNSGKLGAYELVGHYDTAEGAAQAWDAKAIELG